MKMQRCPLCHNHCPIDSLSCSKGKKHFVSEADKKQDKKQEKKHDKVQEERKDTKKIKEYEKKDDLYSLLRTCGHYLHHYAGKSDGQAENPELFQALDEQQKKELQASLKILKESWKK